MLMIYTSNKDAEAPSTKPRLVRFSWFGITIRRDCDHDETTRRNDVEKGSSSAMESKCSSYSSVDN